MKFPVNRTSPGAPADPEPARDHEDEDRRSSSARLLVPTALLALTGCTALVHNAVVNSYPTYQETEASWPPLKTNESRLLVYWPRLPAQGLNPVGPGGFGAIRLVIDDRYSTTVGDQTFVFVDLPPGDHEVTAKTGGFLGTSKTLNVQLNPGQIIYLEVETSQIANKPPRVAAEEEARAALPKIHHNYKNALPFNQQPKRSRPAI